MNSIIKIDRNKEKIYEGKQKDLVVFLERPGFYPHHPKKVQIIQTHISYVAVVEPYVYKIKKPVNFEFLDFSTLEKRRYYCEREVELNRRLCPDTYLEVVSISRIDDRLKLEDDSQVVEYAVKMNHLSEEGFFDRQVKSNKLKKSDLDRLINWLIKFYETQKSTTEIVQDGKSEKIGASIKENFKQTEQFVDKLVSHSAIRALQDFNERFISKNLSLLNSRLTKGHILDCHGDLRLEHVHLDRNQIRIIDCIEFNDSFRHIDVASEVAFLAMELDLEGRSDLAEYFVQQMTDKRKDSDLTKLTNFYKCYRAFVRAKVYSLKSVEKEVEEKEREESQRKAMRLYQLALEYAVSGFRPTIIVIMGRIATGKSTVAQKLSEVLGWEAISSDRERKQLAGVPLTLRLSNDKREQLYTKKMTEKTYKALVQKALELTKLGKSCILDATFGQPNFRQLVRNKIKATKIPYCFIELTARDGQIKKRLSNRQNVKDQISDARLEDFDKLNRDYHPVELSERLNHVNVNSSQTLEDTLFDILKNAMIKMN